MAMKDIVKIAAVAGGGYLVYQYLLAPEPVPVETNGGAPATGMGPQQTSNGGPAPDQTTSVQDSGAAQTSEQAAQKGTGGRRTSGWDAILSQMPNGAARKNYWQWNWHFSQVVGRENAGLDPFNLSRYSGQTVEDVRADLITKATWAQLHRQGGGALRGLGRRDSTPSWWQAA